jgi:hypothetical protein
MTNPGKIATLESEVQAQILGAALSSQGIPHAIRSYHDSAYDGVFQVQKGWGHVEAPPEFKNAILRTLVNIEATQNTESADSDQEEIKQDPPDQAPEVLEPEVLPPEPDIQEERPADNSLSGRLERAFGPILGGLLIDFIDLATLGPVGIFCGMIIGGAAAYWVCSIYRMPIRQRIIWAIAAGVYCTIPFTEALPLATLIGAYARFAPGRKS